ncbi:MAG: 3-methyl-2-oxobutanoate dehydrogenase subunit VorB [Oligosphaeraceae bacterium]|nr:3-methyl-2-oxobutanoate dehydrogenase subunit VorB [Oligosphaeraceae bacterium]
MVTKLVKGNTAVVIGALYAGSDCFFGYPITPASEILHEASRYFPMLGRKFVQAESEEASINMCYGAAAAGHRAFTASSGPGISLMQEGISYLAGAQLPTVIVDIMRAGPGLGNIGPEQSDYNQVVKGGGHGNYRCIVLAPNSVQEMCDFTMLAFDLADKWRTPVYVLADGVLGQMIEPLRFPEKALHPKVDTSWAVAGTPETRKNLVTSIFLDFNQLEEFNEKLQQKYAAIEKEEALYEEQACADADIILVAYGISSRICKSAVESARKEGKKVGLFRPKTLFPFPKKRLLELAQKPGLSFISVEMSNGQMADDLRLATNGSRKVELVSRLGGNLVTLDQVMTKIKAIA